MVDCPFKMTTRFEKVGILPVTSYVFLCQPVLRAITSHIIYTNDVRSLMLVTSRLSNRPLRTRRSCILSSVSGRIVRHKVHEIVEHWRGGLLDGSVVLYRANGSLKGRSYWKGNRMHGVSRMWNRDGQIVGFSEWLYGCRHGIEKEWHANGRLELSLEWIKGEVLIGGTAIAYGGLLERKRYSCSLTPSKLHQTLMHMTRLIQRGVKVSGLVFLNSCEEEQIGKCV